jgi:hypothetical protein
MRAVPEFGRSLLSEVGAPRGRISTYSEVRLADVDGKVSIPDGAIVVEWGKKVWTALLEVKTGTAELAEEQITRYIDLARANGFDAVLTLSNQLTAAAEESPVRVSKAKLKKVELRHLSWWAVITEAVVQHRHRGVSDPDQAWILGELIAYLDHEGSGASGFEDMGSEWVGVRDAARNQTLRAADPQARAVAERWEQLLGYVALGLGQDLGGEVSVTRRRNQPKDERMTELVHALAQHGTLSGGLRVPNAVGPIVVDADLRARRVTTSVRLAAPADKRARGRIGWLLRQLKHARQGSVSRWPSPTLLKRPPACSPKLTRIPACCCRPKIRNANRASSRLPCRGPWVRSEVEAADHLSGTPASRRLASTAISSRNSSPGSLKRPNFPNKRTRPR